MDVVLNYEPPKEAEKRGDTKGSIAQLNKRLPCGKCLKRIIKALVRRLKPK